MNNSKRSNVLAAALLIGGFAILPDAASAADTHGEIVNAATHAQLASKAGTLETVHMHLHHTVNCLVGPNGAGFDAKEMNPCANSGNGAIPDTKDAATKKLLEGALAKAEGGINAGDLASASKAASQTAAELDAIH
jgi:hypothetical protein